MKVTDRTRDVLAFRRQRRDLEAKGYRMHETDWEIHRGGASLHGERIVDAIVSVDGMYVYTLLSGAASTESSK